MKIEVFPSSLSGQALIPASKSAAQRMIACALLAKGESILRNYPDSDDARAALNVVQSLGAVVTRSGDTVKVRGGFPANFLAGIRTPKQSIHCGESGLASRMFTPIAALSDIAITVQGEGSLLSRPFDEFERALPQLSARCDTNKGMLPLTVQGPIQGGKVVVDGSISSQFLTGLLLALPRAQGRSIIEVTNAVSTPYIEMTLAVASLFGVNVRRQGFTKFEIKGAQNFQPRDVLVPADWSSAAFILVAAALCSEDGILIPSLSEEIPQADRAILDVLKMVGAEIKSDSNGLSCRASELHSFEFDANHCPDLFPCLAALAAFGDGVSSIYGVRRLIHKESNRAKVLQEEFGKAGVRIVIREDEMKVYPSFIRPAVINSHNDHRIAMAAAILGLAGAKMTIQGAECVSKSFPEFFDVLKGIGAKLSGTRRG